MAFGIMAAAQLILSTLASPAEMPGQQAGGERGVERGFIYKTVTIDKEECAYCVYVPVDYDSEQPLPLILFLHGSGERGSDGLKQTDVGLPRVIRTKGLRPPAQERLTPERAPRIHRRGRGRHPSRLR